MAATVLNSPDAVKMSLFVVRAFAEMCEQLAANAEILKRLAAFDRLLPDHDDALPLLFRDPMRRRAGDGARNPRCRQPTGSFPERYRRSSGSEFGREWIHHGA
jgi:hypothetical protein